MQRTEEKSFNIERTECTETLEGGDEFLAWGDGVAAAGGDCGVAEGIDWVVGDRVVGGVVGGKDGAGAGVWVYWGYFDWADRVGDWGMDFYSAGDWAREYVFVFAGRGYGWSGAAGGGGAFVFWGEELGERKEFTQRAQREKTELTEVGRGAA